MSRIPISINLHPLPQENAPCDCVYAKPHLKFSSPHCIPEHAGTGLATASREDFSIRTLRDGRHIGICSLYEIDRAAAEASVGIAIDDSNYHGRGCGTNAFMILIGYAFNHLGMQRLNLKTLESNLRARKCFAKCGFNPCGGLRENGNSYLLMQQDRADYVKRLAETKITAVNHGIKSPDCWASLRLRTNEIDIRGIRS
ncbi:MAG: GNAT family N-acetyltransferase [Dehalococcoidia bacterium]|nr:GNAT family N-acetyltransferase [Dehalococcoidia bacterium]